MGTNGCSSTYLELLGVSYTVYHPNRGKYTDFGHQGDDECDFNNYLLRVYRLGQRRVVLVYDYQVNGTFNAFDAPQTISKTIPGLVMDQAATKGEDATSTQISPNPPTPIGLHFLNMIQVQPLTFPDQY